MLMENAFCASKLSLILTKTRQTRSLCIPAFLSFADFSSSYQIISFLSRISLPLSLFPKQFRFSAKKKKNSFSFFYLSVINRLVSFSPLCEIELHKQQVLQNREKFCFSVAGCARSGRLFATRGASGRVGRGATRGQRILSPLEEDRKRVHIQLAETAL